MQLPSVVSLAAAGCAVALAATPANAQSLGAVRNLSFRAGADGQGYVVSWDAPEELSDDLAAALSYEVEDRGDGSWRPIHRGPETRLRVLQMRVGRCRIRVRAATSDAAGPWSETACSAPPDAIPIASTPACRADATTACFLDSRFTVRIRWGPSQTAARPLEGSDDDERSFAFGDDRVAVTVRILDLCEQNGFFGVEYTTRSRLVFRLVVTDTKAAQDKSFAAPPGRDRPPKVRYSEVFSTCGQG